MIRIETCLFVVASLYLGTASASQQNAVQQVMPAVVGIGIITSTYVPNRGNDPLKALLRSASQGNGTARSPASAQPRNELIGSGFNVDPSGLIVTANHVVAGQQLVLVITTDDRVFEARTVAADPQNDVALLAIEPPLRDFPTVPMADSDRVGLAEEVFAIGNPVGLSFSVSKGIVSAVGRNIGTVDGLIQTDAAINPGSSGGPLINTQGQVIGINHAILTRRSGDRMQVVGYDNLGFAIPVNRVKPLVRRGRGGGSLQQLIQRRQTSTTSHP